jgi:hypothetical protein
VRYSLAASLRTAEQGVDLYPRSLCIEEAVLATWWP